MTGSNVVWTIQNILFLTVKKCNIKEVKETLRFACQINISVKTINKLRLLGVPRNFPHLMDDLLTHKKD